MARIQAENEGGEEAVTHSWALKRIAHLIDTIYTYSGVGSNCHIVLDDYNVEDDSIRWVLDDAISENLHESTDHQLTVERECMELLLILPVAARMALVAGEDQAERMLDEERTEP